ncbi:hypothetical protein ACH47Z_33160 [Streptomyces sp. NPDC020192]|uniref:hypothetical protein n=1 Tax=Streptomyces sp. NPDC020192 TaxID=3365066 RepID=UPI0037BB964C
MTDGAQSGQSGNGPGSHGGGAWRHVLTPVVISVVTGLIYQFHGCSPDTSDPAPSSTVTETLAAGTPGPSDEDVSPAPSVSARITRIVSRGTDSGNSSYVDIRVDTDIVGLRGQECVIKWSSYYPAEDGRGGTNTGYSGSSSTGLLSYDDETHWNVLAVPKARYSGWMVHVFLYGPDGTLLAQEDGPTE